MCANVKNMDLCFGECEINYYYPLIISYVFIGKLIALVTKIWHTDLNFIDALLKGYM